MLHVECSNYLWTTNKQQARSSSTPLKQTTRIYTHTYINEKPFKKLPSAFHNLFDYSRFTIKKWLPIVSIQRTEILLKRKGHGEESKSNKGMLGDLRSCIPEDERWPGCEVTLLMLSYCWCFSWAIGSWNPIIYKVLAPSKRWLFGISEPSTARHVRSCNVSKTFFLWIS